MRSQSRSTLILARARGGGSNFLTWPFERRSDLVPGIWTIEIWQGRKKLGEQKFNVILPPIS
jgi:hypothetical protein